MEKNKFYVVQVTLADKTKLLCWKDKKHLYFGECKGKVKCPPPNLFNSKKEASKAIIESKGAKGANMQQFIDIVKAKKVTIIPVILVSTKPISINPLHANIISKGYKK